MPPCWSSWANCSLRPATSSIWSAAASATRCSTGWPNSTWTSPPMPGRSVCSRSCVAGPTGCGTPASSSAPSGQSKRDQRIEITTFRADSYDQVSRNPQVRVRRHARRRPGPSGLHRQRDGGAHRPEGPGGLGEFHDPLGGLAALRAGVLDTPAAPEVSFGDDPLRMLRAARFVSQLGFVVAPRVREAHDADGAGAGPHHRRAGCRRAGQAGARRRPRRGHRPDGADRARRGGAARDRARCRWPSTSTTNTRTSTSIR